VADLILGIRRSWVAILKLGTDHAGAAYKDEDDSRFLFFDPNGGVMVFGPGGRGARKWFAQELTRADQDDYDDLQFVEVRLYRPKEPLAPRVGS
jgi:hypothetical protein